MVFMLTGAVELFSHVAIELETEVRVLHFDAENAAESDGSFRVRTVEVGLGLGLASAL